MFLADDTCLRLLDEFSDVYKVFYFSTLLFCLLISSMNRFVFILLMSAMYLLVYTEGISFDCWFVFSDGVIED